MKTFKEFLSEDAAGDTQSTINRSVTGGDSDTFGGPVSRKQGSVLDYFKRKKKDNNGVARTKKQVKRNLMVQVNNLIENLNHIEVQEFDQENHNHTEVQNLNRERNVQHFLQVRTRWSQEEQLLLNNHHNTNRSLQDQHQQRWLVVDRDLQSDLLSLISQETIWVSRRSTCKTLDLLPRRD